MSVTDVPSVAPAGTVWPPTSIGACSVRIANVSTGRMRWDSWTTASR